MKTNSRFLFAVALGLAMAFVISCSSNDEQNSPAGETTNSTKAKYCVYGEMRTCHSTSQSSCPAGGELSDFCPYDTPPALPSSSSSSPVVRSSSSGGGSLGGSSSSASLSSSSVVLSSYTDKGNNIASYETKKIGDQIWMAENLNYAVEGSRCYGEGGRVVVSYDEETDTETYATLSNAEIQANCDKYGRLYNWEAAKKACPNGWHLPSNADWNVLMKFVNPDCSDNSKCEDAGTKLKARDGWDEGGNGTDDHNFSALPGGSGRPDGNFYGEGSSGYWWKNASNLSSDGASGIRMRYYTEDVRLDDGINKFWLSIRCVKD